MEIGGVQDDFPAGCAIVFGASGGLGEATTAMLASRGANVIGTFYSNPAKLEEVSSRAAASRGSVLPVQCDIQDKVSVDKVVAAAKEKFGRVHSVLGTYGTIYIGGYGDPGETILKRKFDFDLSAFINMIFAVLPALREAGGGSISAIVSPAITRFLPGYGLGVTSRATIACMVRSLAGEEAGNKIRVNCVGPGVINAGLGIKLRDGPGNAVLDGLLESTPMGRAGEAEEVAELLVFLASSRAAYITGQTIMIDGGLSL